MSSFFDNGSKGNSRENLPARLPASSSSLASLAAARSKVTTPAIVPQANGASNSLGDLIQAKKKTEEYRQRPFLVYFIVDLTMSREATRAAVKGYEKQIARLVMESGGKHPILCKGIYFRDDYCSEPQILNSAEDVQKLFDMEAQAGGTRIHQALTHYKNDPTNDILSLAILIGDSADSEGDKAYKLINLASTLNGFENGSDSSQNKKISRPIVIAHETTSYSENFCSSVAPAVAKASGGHSFGLSEQPTELIALLAGYKKILNATPEELKEATKPGAARSSFFSDVSPQGREFLMNQARRMSMPLLGSNPAAG